MDTDTVLNSNIDVISPPVEKMSDVLSTYRTSVDLSRYWMRRPQTNPKGSSAMWRWLNENMRDAGISLLTLHNWEQDKVRPQKRTLQAICHAYPPDDPRHRLAVELMRWAR